MNKDKMPLSKTHPELAKEAHGWDPETVTRGSNKKYKWNCPKGHVYEMAPHSRSGQNQGCPFCGGKRVLQGFNDLATTHPDFASEADGWDPKTVSAGSHIVQNWKCKEGHKFRVNPNQRTSNKSNCPTCANLKILVGFNDLSTLYPKLASEANGWDPKTVGGGSSKRFSWKCQASGHVWESTIINRTANGSNCPVCVGQLVISGINDLSTTHIDLAKEADGWDPKTLPAGSKKRVQWKCSKGHIWIASVGSRAGAQKSGCPVCGNKKVLIGFNDLATTHPDLAKEADGWDPTSLTAGSEKKVQWICSQGHDWKSVVKNRTGPQKQGCPVCRNLKVLIGYNDLATTHPDLAKEADGWDTSTIVAGTSQKKNWKCKLGHSYKASVVSRSNQDRQSGCPVCDGKIVLAGFNDIATTHPELAKQAVDWDTTKVTSGSSRKKLKWKCNEGHVWETTPNIRTGGSGCPTCASTGFDPNQNAYLYFLVQPNWEIYQIGITNVPKDRLGRHKKNGFELLELRGPMDGHTAQELETAILRYLKSQKADLSPEHVAGKFDGYSESWTIDSYQVNNLKELIDKASEAGF